MKKRKSPIVLITFLIVFVSIVVALNYQPSQAAHDHGPTVDEGAKPGEPRMDTPSVADLKKQQKGAQMGQMNPMQNAKKMGMPDEAIPASVMNPETKIHKPVPNDSNISTQWYTDTARKPK